MASVGLGLHGVSFYVRPSLLPISRRLCHSELRSKSLSNRRRPNRALPVWRLLDSEVDAEAETVKEDVEAEKTPEGEAEAETVEETVLDPSFVPVLSREDLPKGERREVLVDGKQIVVFWYRNELFACEARSPAEGAFSTGFLTADFTENYGIVCPGTDSVFSLKTGEIQDWYPTNVVLRSLIPKDTCRNLEVYPVKMTKDTIYISFKSGNLGGVPSMRSKGGSNTSSEADNVFGLEPRVYVEDSGGQSVPEKTTSAGAMEGINPATVLIGTLAVAIVAVSGTAVAIYYESVVGLIVFWLVLFGGVAFTVTQMLGIFED